ncbi:response regulator [Niveispirillum cyanobacteriorum]|uniref:Regulatory protein VirG n=1 Tax=Niveispirillum cyanobacteriorum TaxID=1612173 RepID=A0A2K9NJN0_9PROT|nr:response regulator [Niveispirillum cyanobacteriorum]AUN33282.1 DNA-binding response regulator [Niveispirillum cyanobacteriorum]GGE50012.1 DNA-binding response regulator [Niveispirillum cyanobacteriorum]
MTSSKPDPRTFIAIVEDDEEIADLVAELLGREGFEVAICPDAAELNRQIGRRRVDLVVLDLMLPGEDGLSICRRLHIGPIRIPVIMVTAKGEDIDRVLGLEIGADDYLPKPFNPRELVARVRAVLRRTRDAHRPQPVIGRWYRFTGWSLDAASRTLTDPGGQDVELTGGEFDLLLALLDHPQRLLSRDQLLDWTRGRDAAPFDRTIDVQLSRLRRKLGDDPKAPAMIRTVRGGGYLFAPRVETGGG